MHACKNNYRTQAGMRNQYTTQANMRNQYTIQAGMRIQYTGSAHMVYYKHVDEKCTCTKMPECHHSIGTVCVVQRQQTQLANNLQVTTQQSCIPTWLNPETCVTC